MRIRPLTVPIVLGASLALGAAGCSSGHKAKVAATTTSTSSTTPTTAPATSAPSTTPTTGPTTSTTADPNASSVPGGCTVPQLSVSVVNNGVAAGSVIYVIAFHNHSGQSCTLTGYPGIGLVDASGKPLPLDLVRAQQSPPTTVNLAPGADASFSFRYSDGTGFSQPSCPKAAKMEVTAPNDYGSLVLDAQPAPCSSPGQTPQATVTAVVAGSGA